MFINIYMQMEKGLAGHATNCSYYVWEVRRSERGFSEMVKKNFYLT